MTTLNLHPAAAASLTQWHDMVAAEDLGGLRAITHPDAVFRSPVAHKAYQSADAVVLAVSTAASVFEDFAYHREAATADGLSVVLEFSAKVGDKSVKGIDFIRFNEDGQIVDFEVMMRPLSGVQAMAEEMGQRLGAILPAFKAQG
ncbi:MAG: nuclear transport factor 2 family protein [Brevundimonas sp.]